MARAYLPRAAHQCDSLGTFDGLVAAKAASLSHRTRATNLDVRSTPLLSREASNTSTPKAYFIPQRFASQNSKLVQYGGVILFSVLLAAAAPQSAVLVGPNDPTAPFKGDGTSLKFDPTCRDFTLATLQSNPSCAARVAKGEAAPSLAIAATTLMSLPEKSNDAVRLLERSAALTDSPAVHYFLGSVLGTAERVQPNYRLAVRHLGIAADRGNPAAADLLASLVLAGKGTPRNVPRAIQLYEMAAANGYPKAAIRLGQIYLTGRIVHKDEARGLSWLDAAAAVNVPAAAELAALARGQDKITILQLIPSAEPAKVKVVRYGTFDNADVPPNFGFDPAFQAVYDAPYDDAVTLAWLEKDWANLPTPYLYELSRRLAARDAVRSLTTYLIARIRMTYDASRCADSASLESIQAWTCTWLGNSAFSLPLGGSRVPI